MGYKLRLTVPCLYSILLDTPIFKAENPGHLLRQRVVGQILPCRVGDTTVAFVAPLSNLTFCPIICPHLTLTTLKTWVILMQVR
jgi:hypothetical protein